jgi:hypothetical protein
MILTLAFQVMPGQKVAAGNAIQPQHAVLVGPLTASMLAAIPLQEQKQMLGERLYPLIQRMAPDLASKVTGMLLQIDNAELLHMLDDQNSLEGKVCCGLDLSGCCSILLAGGRGHDCAPDAPGRPVDGT